MGNAKKDYDFYVKVNGRCLNASERLEHSERYIKELEKYHKKMFDMLKEIYIYQDTWSADEVCALLEEIKSKPIQEIINGE